MRRAVFLDRDGVINKAFVRKGKPYPPTHLHEVEVLPGVLEALNKLSYAKYLLIVVTNQPDVVRGSARIKDIEKINNYLADQLPLDAFKICFHDTNHNCKCRKPLPGLILEAAKEYEIDLAKSFMIGDRWRDIEAGQAAGCKTFFINYNYCEKQPISQDYTVKSLIEAKEIILNEF